MDAQSFQHPITVARALRGMSMTDLAVAMRAAARRRDRRAGTTKQQVYAWERPTARPPSEWSQLLMAEALGVDPEHVTALGWPYWLPGTEAPLPLGTGATVAALREAQRRAMLNRRTLLGLAPAAMITLSQQWATLDPALAATATDGRTVDPEFAGWLETSVHQLTSLATADRQHTAPLLDSYYDTVVGLLESASYSEQTGVRLQLLASSLAQTIGWHQFDHEHHSAAARYWTAALHAAHHAGDTDRGAGILSDLAYQSMWLGQGAPAVEVLDHALTRTQDSTARSLLNLRRARALAMTGEARACRRALDAAEHSLNVATTAAPAWCSWMSPADLAVDSGRCLIDLSEPGPAHRQITEGVTLLPTARDKTRAVFLAYEAESLLRQGEVDQGASTAHQALLLARHTGSTRCIRQISDLAPALSGHQHVEGVGQFIDAVRSAA
ncbi:transcriptional regulator with XRE-family HTH domain [Kitasatospora gansuensis]|uniref:Transcriptional regulator with XRE-family HTH domain n=1 Tax=Kitasatospora gansuensis TaxID=258050 RepID=A0A7W7SG54_9ACTN|nr:XRE family transcriptional regulator [Kitasatospora gansuensis]MBB4949477.1 transcriptional regulator with XRE-family HTH domain [Kitasatospora gansuensis]